MNQSSVMSQLIRSLTIFIFTVFITHLKAKKQHLLNNTIELNINILKCHRNNQNDTQLLTLAPEKKAFIVRSRSPFSLNSNSFCNKIQNLVCNLSCKFKLKSFTYLLRNLSQYSIYYIFSLVCRFYLLNKTTVISSQAIFFHAVKVSKMLCHVLHPVSKMCKKHVKNQGACNKQKIQYLMMNMKFISKINCIFNE